MKYLVFALGLAIAACGSNPHIPIKDVPKAPVGDSGPHLAPVASWSMPAVSTETIPSSLVNKQWSVVANYQADDPQAEISTRIFELGGYYQHGGMGLEVIDYGTGGTVECVIWGDEDPGFQTVTKLAADGAFGAHAVACSYDGVSAKLYLDGVLKDSRDVAYVLPSGNMGLGEASYGIRPLSGQVTSIAVYDRAVSIDELN